MLAMMCTLAGWLRCLWWLAACLAMQAGWNAMLSGWLAMLCKLEGPACSGGWLSCLCWLPRLAMLPGSACYAGWLYWLFRLCCLAGYVVSAGCLAMVAMIADLL
jgi:hypothetical protein